MPIDNEQKSNTSEDRDGLIGSDTHAANTGGDIPNDAASYDPGYDPGASELPEELIDNEIEKNDDGIRKPSDRP